MASTISAATLTVKITESILLNGSEQGSTNTLSIGSISQVYKRIVSCPASQETKVVDFHSEVNDATLTPGGPDSSPTGSFNFDGSHNHTFSASGTSGSQGSEARPRNIAMMYIIKV